MIDIYGASDDLIEVEGDISEEFTAPDDDAILALSNGALLRIAYSGGGVWRITPIARPELVKIEQAPEGDDDNYSDHAVVEGTVSWVVCGSEYATA